MRYYSSRHLSFLRGGKKRRSINDCNGDANVQHGSMRWGAMSQSKVSKQRINQQDFDRFGLNYSYSISIEANGPTGLFCMNIFNWLGHVIAIEETKRYVIRDRWTQETSFSLISAFSYFYFVFIRYTVRKKRSNKNPHHSRNWSNTPESFIEVAKAYISFWPMKVYYRRGFRQAYTVLTSKSKVF